MSNMDNILLRGPIEVMSPDFLARWRRLIELDPVLDELRYGVSELRKLDGFSNIAVGAQAVAVDEILLFDGRRENRYG